MKEMKYKGRKALFIAVIIYLLGVIFVTGSWLIFLHHENLNEFDNRLLVAAEALPGLLPRDFHDRALNQNSIGPEEDQHNLDNLSTHANTGGFAYLYTYVMDKGQIYFTASSYTDDDVAQGKISRYWTVYPEGHQAYFDAINSSEPIFVTASDRWGSFRTVLFPQQSSTGKPYVVGADIDISEIDKTLWKQVPWVVAAAFLLLLFAVPIAITTRRTLVFMNNDLRVQLDENEMVVNELYKANEKANQAQQQIELYSTTLERRVQERTVQLQGEIEERKQVEDALRNSEQRLNQLADQSRTITWEVDVHGFYTHISHVADSVFGYHPDEIIGRMHFYDLHPVESRESFKTLAFKYLDQKKPFQNLEHFVRTKDGRYIWVSTNGITLLNADGSFQGYRGSDTDITDRKLAEIELFENRRRLSDIIEFLPDATLAIDKEKRIIIWNREIVKMTGVPAEDMIGKGDYAYTIPFYGEARPQLMDLIFMDDKDIMARYPYLIREGDSLVAEVFCNALYNNKGAWVFLKASPLHDQFGNIIGAIESIRDITERKRAEEALLESEEKLQRSKKMESLGLLAGGVAHDLNNVLSGIVSYPELILMDLPDDSVLRKPIETMKDSGYRAVAIVQDLLTVARGVATIKAPTNLNDLIRDYLKSPEFKTLLQYHPDAVVRTSLEMDLLNVTGSQIHIRKVLMNIVSNAVEALPGKGTVTLATMNCYVERPIKGYEDVAIGEYAVLSVSDDGPGISGDDLKRVFEPFYSKKVMGRSGTGLGLAVVWNVVQDHKGYIDVTTGMNGTTFELYFPITRENLGKENLPIFIDELKGNGETILVVDDVASQRTISCAILNKLGYRTTAVSSGEEAIEFLKENPVDLLLLDMIMDPGINGRETYARALVIRPEQKAIIVSGFAQTEEVLEAKRLGTVQFLRKPVSIEKIGLAVKKALG